MYKFALKGPSTVPVHVQIACLNRCYIAKFSDFGITRQENNLHTSHIVNTFTALNTVKNSIGYNNTKTSPI